MLEIPSRIYSKAIWETIRYRTKALNWDIPVNLPRLGVPAAVSLDTALMLNRISAHFQPRVVAEIGTYIGRSAVAIAGGMEKGVIHTCDSETQLFPYTNWEGISIKQYHSLSTEMFKKLTDPVDLFFFDGRIQPADIEHIQRLSKPESIYLFDDFEGIEKGVCNALMLQHLGGILVLPEEGQTLGMMLRQKISLTRQ